MAKKVAGKKKKLGALILDQLRRLEDKLDALSDQVETLEERIDALKAVDPRAGDRSRREPRDERGEERRAQLDRRYDLHED